MKNAGKFETNKMVEKLYMKKTETRKIQFKKKIEKNDRQIQIEKNITAKVKLTQNDD